MTTTTEHEIYFLPDAGGMTVRCSCEELREPFPGRVISYDEVSQVILKHVAPSAEDALRVMLKQVGLRNIISLLREFRKGKNEKPADPGMPPPA